MMSEHEPRPNLSLPEMEAQHAYLYGLFDRIPLTTRVEDPSRMKALLEEIERYVLFHFTSEETLMRRYGLPGFGSHQTDHENAGARLVTFLDDFDAGTLNPAALRTFLTGWLMQHTVDCDQAYVAWILEKRRELEGGATAGSN